MNLPKPRKNDSLENYWKRFSKDQMPTGQTFHVKTRHSPKHGQNSRAVSFSIDGECRGPIAQVMDLGLRLAKSAAAKGDESQALQILDRLERLPKEYELKLKLSQLKAQNTIMKKSA